MLPNTGSASSPALRELLDLDGFIPRHIGPDEDQVSRMLDAIGVESVEALIAETVPASIRMEGELDLEGAVPESEVLDRLRALADRNTVVTSCIGTGWLPLFLISLATRFMAR